MKTFKEFIAPKEFITFCNAGGREGQYDKFNYSGNMQWGQGGGAPIKEEIDENLNPRVTSEKLRPYSRFLFDPETDNRGLGEDHNHPENIEIPDYHGNGHVNPRYTNEQAKNAQLLSKETEYNDEKSDDYYDIIPKYTSNSYRLNNTLYHHHGLNTKHPDEIPSNDEDEDSLIHVPTFDSLIRHHRLPKPMTVYSGLHFHPNEHRGKIAVIPSYMSTSLSPNVAKDFGKEFNSSVDDDYAPKIKNILRLHLPEGHPALYTDNASHFPGQGELILERGTRFQFGQKPTHIIRGAFDNHFGPHRSVNDREYHIYTGRILPRK